MSENVANTSVLAPASSVCHECPSDTDLCTERDEKRTLGSESESEWLESKMNSASSVTATQVRRVDVGGER